MLQNSISQYTLFNNCNFDYNQKINKLRESIHKLAYYSKSIQATVKYFCLLEKKNEILNVIDLYLQYFEKYKHNIEQYTQIKQFVILFIEYNYYYKYYLNYDIQQLEYKDSLFNVCPHDFLYEKYDFNKVYHELNECNNIINSL